MTPGQFARRMAEIAKIQDIEARHQEADELLCEALAQLGYAEGVDVFKHMEKWYA